MKITRLGSGGLKISVGCDDKIVGESLGIELDSSVSHEMGPMKWCNRCSREHRSRIDCDLYLRDRPTRGPRPKSNRLNTRKLVKRWAH